MTKRIIIFLFASVLWLSGGIQDTDEKFLESFIRYYDASTSGRYTHEYHPFLFEKSSYSLDEMEKKLTDCQFKIKGRIVLTGYEEQAIPAYYTHYKVCTGSKINDEVRVRDGGGWTEQQHNKFGVMTGYLFRDVSVVNQVHLQQNKYSMFDHINLNTMPIYNPESYIFQRHAFGRMLPIMQKKQLLLGQKMINRDSEGIFSELIDFWQKLYENELRFGNRKVLGTQDILFSIAHAQHLLRSGVPLFRYYVGPDITYPIKVTKLQKSSATRNAQTFVQKFVKHLKSIDGERTVYIFCSFVDGVGKSTLLGNVENFSKYGTDFDSYDPVDNSSSQLSQLYKYSDDVFIADLPAQMSHFTYKPDGMVYLDVLAAQDEEELDDLYDFVHTYKGNFVEDYNKLIVEVRETIKDNGLFDSSLCDPSRPERAFAKNVLLLKKENKNKWIPFSYNKGHYLFNYSNPDRIRKVMKLDIADSIGLKNYEAEQMLFFEGVRFPLPYDFFVDDLIEKFKKVGIKNVVFVNFLSMYPRSSRENIRVNYLLQQLSLLYDDFSLEESLYGPFAGDSHLLYKLKSDRDGKILHALKKEAFVRLCLYNMMEQQDLRTVEGTSLDTVTDRLEKELQILSPKLIKQIDVLAGKKINEERELLERVHGKTSNFINIQELDFDKVVKFGEKLQNIFEKYVKNNRLKELWRKPGDVVGNFEEIEGEVNQKIRLSDGTSAQLLFVVSSQCKDEMLLAPVVRCIRTSWYSAIANLVSGTSKSSKIITVEEEKYFIPPVWVKKTKGGKIAVFRRIFKENKKKLKTNDEKIVGLLNISRRIGIRWGVFKDKPYFLSIDRAQTNKKFFALGCDVNNFDDAWPELGLVVSSFVYEEQHKKKNNSDEIVFASKLWSEIKKGYWWKAALKETVDQAKDNQKKYDEEKKKNKSNKNGFDKKDEKDKEEDEKSKNAKELILLGQKDNTEVCRLVVRALATLEMVIKDPVGQIAVQHDNKKDFVAALKLFEKIMLPTYFNIIFEKDLFSNYQSVKSFI